MHAGGDTFMTDFGIRIAFEEHNGHIDSALVGAGRVRSLRLIQIQGETGKRQ
jgi:hypothetical protein